MTGSEFLRLYGNLFLKRKINQLACHRSRRTCVRDEYRQEAWLWIGMAPGGYDYGYYVDIAEKAIESAYWANRRDVLGKRERADFDDSRLYAIAHNLNHPPHYSDGYVTPRRPTSDRYPAWYDPEHPGYT